MRRFIAASLAASALTFGALSLTAQAADDPSIHQIYEAATTGHLDQAQQMIEQVLKDHPESSKAHYVQAELFAREGKFAPARSELARAEQLDPGLTKENPQSVSKLKSEIGLAAAPRASQSERPFVPAPGMPVQPTRAHFPWGTVLILALVVAVFWMIFRRRTYGYPAGGGGVVGPGPGYGGPGPGYGAGPGYGPGPGGGVGSSIAGGLAGGLAAGAGIVAGEELAHHFLDGDRHEGGAVPPANAGEWNNAPDPNSNMGGADFGVNDPGSWDNGGGGSDFGGGGGGGGGGDDWT
jgi:hypothetical protein